VLTRYPFNRATRVELSGGPRVLGFDRELQTQVFDPITGQQIANEETNLAAPSSVKLGQASAAFVHDTSVFGATGPVVGTRSRFEITPLFEDLTFSEVTADYRRYFERVHR
jgi:hypothetical protein